MYDQCLLFVTHSKWPGFGVVLCKNTARNKRKGQHPKVPHGVHCVVEAGALFFDKKNFHYSSQSLTICHFLGFVGYVRPKLWGQPRGKGLQSQLCSLNKLSSCWHGILFSLRPVSQYHLNRSKSCWLGIFFSFGTQFHTPRPLWWVIQ